MQNLQLNLKIKILTKGTLVLWYNVHDVNGMVRNII